MPIRLYIRKDTSKEEPRGEKVARPSLNANKVNTVAIVLFVRGKILSTTENAIYFFLFTI